MLKQKDYKKEYTSIDDTAITKEVLTLIETLQESVIERENKRKNAANALVRLNARKATE